MILSTEILQKILQEKLNLNDKTFAYLSLTHKNEFNIRDSLAIALQKEYPIYSVGRELKKIDLSMIQGNKIKVAIEIKSMYLSEILYKNQSHLDGLKEDFNKSLKLSENIFNEMDCKIDEIYGIAIYVFAKDTHNIERSGAELKRAMPELTYPTLITKINGINEINEIKIEMDSKTDKLFPEKKFIKTDIFQIKDNLWYKDIKVEIYGQVIQLKK